MRGLTSLHFFPIDNKLGRGDPVVADFLNACESSLNDLNYVKQKVPLTWLKFMDEFGDLVTNKNSNISLSQAKSIASNCGVTNDEEILEMLKFCRKV